MVLFLLLTYFTEECGGQDISDLNSQFMSTFKLNNNLPETVSKDFTAIDLTAPEQIIKYGYPVETHVIQTDDGYLLTVHRIPHGRSSSDTRVRAPVLLMHGLFDSSDGWILLGPEKSLGFVLADAGYDVWMGNARGNFYSRKHVSLSPTNTAFWNFSFHEMGNNDLPVVIDYILDTTNQKQLFFIGHSLGTNMFFVLTSMKPEYNKKIRLMVALAPGVYIKKQPSLFGLTIFQYGKTIADGFFQSGQVEVLPRIPSNGQIAQILCRDGQMVQAICASIYYRAFGNSANTQLNKTLLPSTFAHFPSGSSVATLDHLLVTYMADSFVGYDKSRRLRPMPKYDLRQVRAPVALYYGLNDALVHPEGVFRLAKELPNVVEMLAVSDNKFNHVDFILGIDANKLVYNNVISLMARY